MEKMINTLKNLGLTRYEAQAYIGLNRIITGQADEVAKVSDLPRSKTYDILKNLEKKGFIEIKRGRPLIYKVIEPKIIFQKEKEKLIKNLDESEKRLEEIYNNQISEVQAPIWLVHSTENIIEKEISIIKKARKSITIRIGFLLENEGNEMIKAFNEIPRNVKIRIIANPECYINNKKHEIITLFEKAKIDNLEILKADLPLAKFLIRDGKELFGTFAKFDGQNNSIIPQTAIGVWNQYDDLCKNFDEHFVKQFNQIKGLNNLFNKIE